VTLESGEDIISTRFVRFFVKDKKARKGRNPHPGEDLMLDARKVVRFTGPKVLTEKLKGR
jgi:nucleoid DNA-binding protein